MLYIKELLENDTDVCSWLASYQKKARNRIAVRAGFVAKP
jgi:hypothetical protein